MQGQVDFWEDYESITVETPEALELRLPLAGFGPRFLAVVLDSLFQGVASVILIVVAVLAIIPAATVDDSVGVMTGFLIIIFLGMIAINFGYFFIFEMIWNGQTPGKRMTGIRVVRRGGLPLTFREVMLRNLIRLADYLPSHGFIGMVSFIFTKHQQRLGDLVADTVVIREFRNNRPFSWEGTIGSGGSRPNSWLTPRLSYAIGSYLSRCMALPIEVRLDFTRDVIKQLGHDPSGLSLNEREGYLAALLRGPEGQQ